MEYIHESTASRGLRKQQDDCFPPRQSPVHNIYLSIMILQLSIKWDYNKIGFGVFSVYYKEAMIKIYYS